MVGNIASQQSLGLPQFNDFGEPAGASSAYNIVGFGSGLTDAVNGNQIEFVMYEVMLLPLANYGGPTETMPPMVGSPAIDAGSNSLIPSGVTTDQRGLPRIANGTVDIGAVEAQTNIAGSSDSTFGSGGFLTLPPPTGRAPESVVLAVQPNGRIVVAFQSGDVVQVSRLLADGSPDPSFDDGGTTSLPAGDTVSQIFIESDGTILLAGNVAVRLNANGSLDTVFADGSGIEPLPSDYRGIALQASAAFVVSDFGGPSYSPAQVVRYNADGSLDTTFGTDGASVLPLAYADGYYSIVGGLAVDSSGRILVSVSEYQTPAFAGDLSYEYGVMRLLPNGKVDTSFGTNGLALDPSSDLEDSAIDYDGAFPGPIAVAANGDIYQLGYIFGGDNAYASWLYAYGANGQSPSQMGDSIAETGENGDFLAVQPDSKPVVLAYPPSDQNGPIYAQVFRFQPYDLSTGQVLADTTFGLDGTANVSLPDNGVNSANVTSLALAPDSRIFIGGDALAGSVTEYGSIACLLADQQLGSVSGTVFNDTNGDGIQETGEAGLAGRTVYADPEQQRPARSRRAIDCHQRPGPIHAGRLADRRGDHSPGSSRRLARELSRPGRRRSCHHRLDAHHRRKFRSHHQHLHLWQGVRRR